MRTISFVYDNELPKSLDNLKAKSILVQIYDGKHNEAKVRELIKKLKDKLTNPIIVGKSAKISVVNGEESDELVCIVSVFDKAQLKMAKVTKASDFKNKIYALLEKDTKGFLLLSNHVSKFEGILDELVYYKAYDFFGSLGGRDDTYGIYGDEINYDDLIIVSFSGDLEIHTKTLTGFVGVGEYEHITKVEGTRIYEINNKSVLNYFKDFLKLDEATTINLMTRIPLGLSKDEYNPLKILTVYEDGSIEVPRVLKPMDHVRITIANFDLLEQELKEAFNKLNDYNVESIYLYSAMPPIKDVVYIDNESVKEINDECAPLNGVIGRVNVVQNNRIPSFSSGSLVLVSMAENETDNEFEYNSRGEVGFKNIEEQLIMRLLTDLATKYDKLSNYISNTTNEVEHEYELETKYIDEYYNLPNYNQLVKDLYENELEYNVSVSRLTNERVLRDFYGDDMVNECKKELINQILREYKDDVKLYIIKEGFASVSTKSEAEHKKMLKEVYQKMFKFGFSFKDELIDFGFSYATVYKGTKNALIKAKRALYDALENGYISRDYRDTFDSAFELKEGIDHYSLVSNAYKNNGFKVYYQGIYSVKQNCINHFEALIRIKDDRTGKVYSPAAFIETAYKFGYSKYITTLVMKQAFEEVSKHECAISLNLRLTDIEDDDLYYLLLELLDKYNCFGKVMLEILEDINIMNNPLSLERLKDLREMGIRIAIDDFGAGYSNFDYLKPDLFDYIKISGELTKNLSYDNEVMMEMVKSVVLTSHRLGMKVVVEYCEDEETADLLTELGADYIQGFYFSKPAETIEVLDKHFLNR